MSLDLLECVLRSKYILILHHYENAVALWVRHFFWHFHLCVGKFLIFLVYHFLFFGSVFALKFKHILLVINLVCWRKALADRRIWNCGDDCKCYQNQQSLSADKDLVALLQKEVCRPALENAELCKTEFSCAAFYHPLLWKYQYREYGNHNQQYQRRADKYSHIVDRFSEKVEIEIVCKKIFCVGVCKNINVFQRTKIARARYGIVQHSFRRYGYHQRAVYLYSGVRYHRHKVDDRCKYAVNCKFRR